MQTRDNKGDRHGNDEGGEGGEGGEGRHTAVDAWARCI